MIERIHPKLDQYVATPEFAFHLAVKTDGIVFTQGVAPISTSFEVVGRDDLIAQCEFTLKTLKGILESAGSSPRHMQSHVAERLPELPGVLLDLDRQAFDHARDLFNDSNYGISAFGRLEIERERVDLDADVWPRGIAANRVNLERFIDDMVEQKLIPEPLSVEDLFHPSTHDS